MMQTCTKVNEYMEQKGVEQKNRIIKKKSGNNFSQLFLKKSLFLVLLIAMLGVVSAANPFIEKWGIFNIELKGPSVGNPYADVELSAVFKNNNKELKVTGFYDGDGKYIIRFSPDTEGQWTYQTSSK